MGAELERERERHVASVDSCGAQFSRVSWELERMKDAQGGFLSDPRVSFLLGAVVMGAITAFTLQISYGN